MNGALVVATFGGLVLLLWLLTWGVVGSVERSPEVLTGELWQTMSPNAEGLGDSLVTQAALEGLEG